LEAQRSVDGYCKMEIEKERRERKRDMKSGTKTWPETDTTINVQRNIHIIGLKKIPKQ